MKTTFIAAFVMGVLATAANAGTIRVGFSNSFAGHIFDYNGGMGAYLDNPAFTPQFGHSFTRVNGRAGNLVDYLQTVDIYWSDLPIGAPISDADRDALIAFIDNGGVVIANNDRTTVSPFTELFPLYAAYGVTAPDNQLTQGGVFRANNLHPIMNGPFGPVGAFIMSDAGRFTVSGDTFTTLMTWDNGDVAAGLVDMAPGRKGALILLPDFEATGTQFNCCAFPTQNANTLALNSWAYAAQVAFAADQPADVPEPAMLVLFGLGAAGLGFAARRR